MPVIKCRRWTSQMPCGCVAIGLRGGSEARHAFVGRQTRGRKGTSRGHCDLDARARPFRVFDIDGPSFRLSEAPQAELVGSFPFTCFDAASRHCSAPLRGSGICDMICDLLTPRGPRAPSVQGRASPYKLHDMHKLPCCACFYYVALSRIVY